MYTVKPEYRNYAPAKTFCNLLNMGFSPVRAFRNMGYPLEFYREMTLKEFKMNVRNHMVRVQQ